MKWFEVKAINIYDGVEASDLSVYGHDCVDALEEHLQVVTEYMRRQNPGCKIVVRQG